MSVESPPLEEKPECYVPKMKPGDVEIPNRVFVKGFAKDASVDDLFTFFERYGKVLECRIVADKYGCSKGFGFVTFDSQNVAETVKGLERIKYTDQIELVIGPARIRKKRFYLLPAQTYNQPQPFYASDGSMVWATPMPQTAIPQPQMVSTVPVSSYQPQQTYTSPVILSVVSEPQQYTQQYTQQQQPQQYTQTQPQQQYTQTQPQQQYTQTQQQQPQQQQTQQCITYQPASPQNVNVIEKVEYKQIQTGMVSPVCVDDTQQVPCISPVPTTGYVDVQHTYNVASDGIVYSPMVPVIQAMHSLHV